MDIHHLWPSYSLYLVMKLVQPPISCGSCHGCSITLILCSYSIDQCKESVPGVDKWPCLCTLYFTITCWGWMKTSSFWPFRTTWLLQQEESCILGADSNETRSTIILSTSRSLEILSLSSLQVKCDLIAITSFKRSLARNSWNSSTSSSFPMASSQPSPFPRSRSQWNGHHFQCT